MQALSSRALAVLDAAARPRFLMGAAIFRIVSGLTILWEYLGVYRQRHFLFGPNGIEDWETFARAHAGASLYALTSSTLFFEVVYHLGALVALLWVIGWRTRWMTVLNVVFWRSLQAHTDALWDGGDNLMQLALVYACFADVGAYFSLDAMVAEGEGGASAVVRGRGGAGAAAAAVVHNAAMLALAVQLCLVYGCAGLAKARGEMWINGTALYYALRAREFTLPGVSELVFRRPFLVTFLTYCTLAFQLGFTFFLFLNRYARRFIVAVSVAFHLGIMTFMGLTTFALFMMAVDLALLDDDEYRALGRAARWAFRACPRLRRPRAARAPHSLA